MTSARMPVWMERKLWYRLMWETERTTDLNVFYDKSLHPDLCSLSLKCTFDAYTSSAQGIRTGIYEYRDETFNHDAFLVVLFFHSIHFVRILSRRFFSLVFLLNSPHGMRMCCSLSIDSFCDFYSHFQEKQKEKKMREKQITYPCAVCLASFYS